MCAPSNGAVDEITLRLQREGLLNADGNKYKPELVRLGAVDPGAEEDVKAASLESKLEIALEKSAQKKSFDNAEAEVVRLKRAQREAQTAAMEARTREVEHRRLARKEGQVEEGEWSRQAEMKQRTTRAALHGAYQRMRECLRALEAERSRLRISLIRDAKIVLCTLSTAASPYLSEAVTSTSRGFGTVVIDEAGQAVEPSTLIPLRYGCRNLILVGDPRQLPATVMSPVVQRFKYERSLFERLEKGGHPVHLLRVQYRMRPAICRFPSQAFYENKLLNAPSLVAAEEEGGELSTYDKVPYFGAYKVFDVSRGRETRRGNGISNEGEAAFAVQLFGRFKLEFPHLVGQDQVAVITPYRAQVRLLEQKFMREYGMDWGRMVEISTVDKFQGREKEVILFSCVRANVQGSRGGGGRGGIGFLADQRRMNVGLTRARRSLFVLGHRASLSTDRMWNALIEDADERECLVDSRGMSFDQLALEMLRGREEKGRELPQGPRPLNKNAVAWREKEEVEVFGSAVVRGGEKRDVPPRPSPLSGPCSRQPPSKDISPGGLLKGLLTRCDAAKPVAMPTAVAGAAKGVAQAPAPATVGGVGEGGESGGGWNKGNGRRHREQRRQQKQVKEEKEGQQRRQQRLQGQQKHQHQRNQQERQTKQQQPQYQISAQDLAAIEEQLRQQQERATLRAKQRGPATAPDRPQPPFFATSAARMDYSMSWAVPSSVSPPEGRGGGKGGYGRGEDRRSSSTATLHYCDSNISGYSSGSDGNACRGRGGGGQTGGRGGGGSKALPKRAAPGMNNFGSQKRPQPIEQVTRLGQSKKAKGTVTAASGTALTTLSSLASWPSPSSPRSTGSHSRGEHSLAVDLRATTSPLPTSINSSSTIPRKFERSNPSYSARAAALSSYVAGEAAPTETKNSTRAVSAFTTVRPQPAIAATAAARPSKPRLQENRPSVSLTSLMNNMPGVG